MVTTGSGAETYGVVYTLVESPLKAGMLWAGTDDGKVWLTEDDGGTWTDLTATLPAPTKGQWIHRIEASWHDPNVAYLTVGGYRTGNYAPLIYRTADKGKSWVSVAGDVPADEPARVLREDPKNPNLLYLGTEFALRVSADQGKHWIKLGGLPTVMVDDILVHPRDNDLVIATHGRSIYIVDDISALQQLTPEVQAKTAQFFAPRAAVGFVPLDGWVDSEGGAIYRGANPPSGAVFTYWLKEPLPNGASFAITDSAGTPVANLKGPGFAGLNRTTWDLRPTSDLLISYGGTGQKFVRAGTYTVTMSAAGVSDKRTVVVTHLPGIETR